MNFIIYLFAFLKNAIYGSSVYFTASLTQSTDVLDILSLRFLLSLVVLWFLKSLKVLKINVGIKDFFRKASYSGGLKNLLLAALFEPILYMLFETLGISMTTGITAGVILSLSPISACIAESVLLKEKNTTLQKFFLALGIVGVIYIALKTPSTGGKDTPLGIIFMFLAVMTGSLFCVFSRKSSKSFTTMEITYITCMLGALSFNAVNIIRHLAYGNILNYFSPYMNTENMIGFIFLSVISTILATGMNNFALSAMKISTMAAFGGVSTLVTIFIGVAVCGEKLMPYHIIGLILIVTRMVGVSYIDIKNGK